MGIFSGGFFGGGTDESRSSSTNTTTNQQKTSNVAASDNSEATSIQGQNQTVNMLDEGVIEKALAMAESVYARSTDTLEKSINGAMSSVGAAYKSAGQVGDPIDINQTIKWVVGGLVSLGLFFSLRKGKK